MSLESNPTPADAKLVKKVRTKKDNYPKLIENSHVKKIYADVDAKGTLIIPDEAPEHVKDWVRHGHVSAQNCEF